MLSLTKAIGAARGANNFFKPVDRAIHLNPPDLKHLYRRVDSNGQGSLIAGLENTEDKIRKTLELLDIKVKDIDSDWYNGYSLEVNDADKAKIEEILRFADKARSNNP